MSAKLGGKGKGGRVMFIYMYSPCNYQLHEEEKARHPECLRFWTYIHLFYITGAFLAPLYPIIPSIFCVLSQQHSDPDKGNTPPYPAIFRALIATRNSVNLSPRTLPTFPHPSLFPDPILDFTQAPYIQHSLTIQPTEKPFPSPTCH